MDTDAEQDVTINLSERYPSTPAAPPSQDEIITWLRNSGGTLRERMMKHAAADLIEATR